MGIASILTLTHSCQAGYLCKSCFFLLVLSGTTWDDPETCVAYAVGQTMSVEYIDSPIPSKDELWSEKQFTSRLKDQHSNLNYMPEPSSEQGCQYQNTWHKTQIASS